MCCFCTVHCIIVAINQKLIVHILVYYIHVYNIYYIVELELGG